MKNIEEKFGQIQSESLRSQTMTHFQVYQNLNFVSERKFEKDQITIGRSRQADLFLDHQSVADIHALVNFQGEQAILTNRFPQNGLRLNGMPVRTAQLKHEDVIVIGPFALKVQVKERPASSLDNEKTSYAVRLVNRYGSVAAMKTAAVNLSKMFRTDLEKILPLVEKEHVVVKKGLGGIEAAQIQNAMLKAGIICDVQLEEKQPSPPTEVKPSEEDSQKTTAEGLENTAHSTVPEYESVAKNEVAAAVTESENHSTSNDSVQAVSLEEAGHIQVPEPEAVSTETQSQIPSANSTFDQTVSFVENKEESVTFPQDYFPVDEEADEDGEIWDAPFTLNQILSPIETFKNTDRTKIQLQVVKTMGSAVVDVACITNGQTYPVEVGGRRMDVVRYIDDQEVVIFSEAFGGVVLNSSGVITADLNNYKTETYRSRKNRSAFEIPLPDDGAVIIDDGACQYRIDRVPYAQSPQVEAAPAEKTLIWKHWATSLGLHLMFFLVIAIHAFFQAHQPEKQELHFVKIDKSMLAQMEKPKIKPEPKKPTPVKPVAQEAKKEVAPPPAKKVEQKANTTVKNTKNAKIGKKAVAGQNSKHPKAGGGFGKGNIKNRNINQTGLLSVLGGTSASASDPSQAMVAVTNLDAVSVPGATEKNFSVGGLKGALGDGKISVATGQIVQTKGSSQVLRSGGARGKGEVAALERGTTGKKKVQAMVTAKMNRTVKIEGGMSREMVKRVIDQHLDEITYCYETALMSNPSILGRIVFEWKIMRNGRVGEIRIVASSVNSNQIHGCIKSAIQSWQFPKPVGSEVIVSYPFVFDLVSF